MTRQFEGRTALITGGGTGVGRVSALALAAEGCLVTVCGRTAGTLEETVGLVEAAGGAARFVECDVSDERSVKAAVKAAIGDTGRLDFGVNSAGVSGGEDLKPTPEYETDRFDLMIATDLRGTFLAMKYELGQMKAQGFGSVVNISSGAGPRRLRRVLRVHGGETRAARSDENRGARLRGRRDPRQRDRGRVNRHTLVADRPPEVMAARIAMHALGRLAQASEIADVVVWLCSEKPSFVTGAAVPVDVGYTAR